MGWIPFRAAAKSVLVIAVMLGARRLAGQPPADPPVPPVIPETTVTGRPGGDFPATPLESGTVLSAERSEEPLSQTGSSVTVITSEQIDRTRFPTVLDVLRNLPGVDVVQQGGPGRVASIFLRGANSEHTKVLLDGIPINDPISPGRFFDFSTLQVDNLERIEILRGPQSVLYGSDAIGGVILIVTRRGSGPLSGKVGGMGGSFGTSQQLGSLSGGNDQFYYSLGGSYFETDGFSAASSRLPGNEERDGYRNGTLSARGGWTPFENLGVDLVFRYSRAGIQIDDAGGPFQDDPDDTNKSEQFFGRMEVRHTAFGDLWEQRFALNLADHNRYTIDPRDELHPVDFFFSQFDGRTTSLDWQHDFRLFEWNTLTAGVTDQQEAGDSSFRGESFFIPFEGTTPRQVLRDTAVFVEDRIQLLDNWTTTVGIRQDHYSVAGTANTYRLTSIVQVPATSTSFRGSLGTGFKAPTLFQIFDAFSGNPNLEPEESKGWDVGFEQSLGDGHLTVGATYFRNDFSNLIDFDLGTFRFFNVGQALATGVEIEGRWQWNDATSLWASYTRTDTEDRGTQLQLLRRPKHKANLQLDRTLFGDLAAVHVGMLVVGERDDRDLTGFPPRRVSLADYVLVNVAGSINLTRRCELYGRIDNLLDKNYEEVFGFGTAGVSGYAGLNLIW